jgi:hypothetical protein
MDPMHRILLRFNTKWEQDDLKRRWRLLVDGEERLAHKVLIWVEGETITEPVDGEAKDHILLHGHVAWGDGFVAKIFGERET